MSIHLFFCLPRLRSPCTSDFIILLMLVSPDRSTCPYHLSLASRILFVMHATPIFFRLSNINSYCDPASGVTTLALLAGSRNTTATRSQLSIRAGRDWVRERL